MKIFKIVKITIHVLLTVFIVLYIITGFGITEYQIIQSITFNIFSKPTSHMVHNNLIIPFLALLILHILVTTKPKYFKRLINRFDKNE